jgi:hypothetical protein
MQLKRAQTHRKAPWVVCIWEKNTWLTKSEFRTFFICASLIKLKLLVQDSLDDKPHPPQSSA